METVMNMKRIVIDVHKALLEVWPDAFADCVSPEEALEMPKAG